MFVILAQKWRKIVYDILITSGVSNFYGLTAIWKHFKVDKESQGFFLKVTSSVQWKWTLRLDGVVVIWIENDGTFINVGFCWCCTKCEKSQDSPEGKNRSHGCSHLRMRTAGKHDTLASFYSRGRRGQKKTASLFRGCWRQSGYGLNTENSSKKLIKYF